MSEQLGLTLRRRDGRGRQRYVRSRAVPENDLHAGTAKLLAAVLDPVCTYWTTVPAGGYDLAPQAAVRLARLGYKSGTPDVLLWWAIGVGECGAGAIELKSANGRLTKTRVVHTRRGSRVVVGQTDRHLELRAAGVHVAVCRSHAEVLAALAQWHVPLRATSAPGAPLL